MGSELYDTVEKKVVWGLSNPGWLVNAWTGAHGGLGGLHLTPDEREGRLGRIVARRLLTAPAWAPVLKGHEPYPDLVATATAAVADPDAVLPFAYDWRLPVATNARLLAAEARRHLTYWRGHEAHARARRHRVDEREGRLVFVAHSMGGLVTLAALTGGYDNDLEADTRGVMTLGAPFRGAVNAAVILNSGQGSPVPLPHRRLRELAVTLPGVHDLLPRFPCLDEGTDVRVPSTADIVALGGDPYLAEQSRTLHEGLSGKRLPGHRAVVGINQSTLQSMTLDGGTVTGAEHSFRLHTDGTVLRDRTTLLPHRFPVGGDGTVHKESAALGREIVPVSLQHGALAQGSAAMDAVASFLKEDEHLGPTQAGGAGLGLLIPDVVTPGSRWEIRVTGVDSPKGITCEVQTVPAAPTSDGPRPVGPRPIRARLSGDDHDGLTARVTLPASGLYRVTVDSGNGEPLTQLLLAAESDGKDH
ncbi:hypothetical protein DVK44_21080 [Streptomyces paludis]|uniref:Lecithin--cholesterol acyltransferase n=2 Tax=Streptomyces paludis TaxID=2282738 RepID=A0A345I1G5_9ACTN|nr:hypothetical protein [Streptomyces paludis]AXG82789.1 hypothetical protein DVK44_21080 [Streptomyces paludis]